MVEKSANLNRTLGLSNIGHMYHYGYGVKQDYAEALKWYKKAADLGDTWSMNRIGNLYYNGEGVEENYEEALKWYKKAENNEYACYSLGWMYEFGQGTDKNTDTALSYYKKAVENGHYNENYKWDSAFRYADILFRSNRENEALEFLANAYNDPKSKHF